MKILINNSKRKSESAKQQRKAKSCLLLLNFFPYKKYILSTKRGFTLIEILLVTAMIGVLASIILVNTNISRQKARIAAGQRFSQSVYKAIGDYATGVWSFDDGTAKDESGNGNNGTKNGTTIVNGMIRNALSFNGASDYVDFVNAPLNAGSAMTVEAWVKSNADAAYSVISKGAYFTIFQGWHISTASSPSSLLFEISDGVSRNYVNFGTGRRFDWTHIAAVRDGNKIYAYTNGVLKDSLPTAIGSSDNSVNLMLGRRASSAGYYFNGVIDEVRVYNKAMTAAEIQKRYAEGIKKHDNLAKK